ncbi:MAG: hypothetical protein ACOX6L_09285 [Syntrophomonadaceae bacterium]|jgi:hypothetical protein
MGSINKSCEQINGNFSSCSNQKCHPEKGDLVRNGSFEIGVCGAGWECIGNVKPQDQIENTGHNAHTGTGAVALGLNEANQGANGSISQVVDGICPGITYEFGFFMSPHSYAEDINPISFGDNLSGNCGNGEVVATLTFLNKYLNPINDPIEIRIPGDTLAWANIWTYYQKIAVAPYGARSAQIKIAISDPYWNWQEHVHIDDVSLLAL